MNKIFLTLCLVFAGPSAFADAPTFAETVDFIKRKTDSSEFIFEALQTCGHLSLTERYSDGGRMVQTVPISELNPNDYTVVANRYTVQFNVREDRDLAIYKNYEPKSQLSQAEQNSWVCQSEVCTIENRNSYIWLKVSTYNQDDMERVVRAVQHIVRMCGGKDELF